MSCSDHAIVCYDCSVPELIPNVDVKDAQFDAVIVVTDKVEKLVGNLACLVDPLKKYEKVNTLKTIVVPLIKTRSLPIKEGASYSREKKGCNGETHLHFKVLIETGNCGDI